MVCPCPRLPTTVTGTWASAACLFATQDGALPHWGTIACNSLNDHIIEKSVGKGGQNTWLPRSPYIMPLDFLH